MLENPGQFIFVRKTAHNESARKITWIKFKNGMFAHLLCGASLLTDHKKVCNLFDG